MENQSKEPEWAHGMASAIDQLTAKVDKLMTEVDKLRRDEIPIDQVYGYASEDWYGDQMEREQYDYDRDWDEDLKNQPNKKSKRPAQKGKNSPATTAQKSVKRKKPPATTKIN